MAELQRFCRCSAQPVRTEPDGPESTRMVSPPACPLSRSDATEVDVPGRTRTRPTRLKTARSAVRSRPCPPQMASAWATVNERSTIDPGPGSGVLTIRKRRGGWQVIVYAGLDPLTGKQRQFTRQVNGSRRQAEKVEACLRTEVADGQHAGTRVKTLGELVDLWVEARCCSPPAHRAGQHRPRHRQVRRGVGRPGAPLGRQRRADHARRFGVLVGQDHPGLPPPPDPLLHHRAPCARPGRSAPRSPPSQRTPGSASSTPTVAWRRPPRPATRVTG
jgi:hypothetical protein